METREEEVSASLSGGKSKKENNGEVLEVLEVFGEEKPSESDTKADATFLNQRTKSTSGTAYNASGKVILEYESGSFPLRNKHGCHQKKVCSGFRLRQYYNRYRRMLEAWNWIQDAPLSGRKRIIRIRTT